MMVDGCVATEEEWRVGYQVVIREVNKRVEKTYRDNMKRYIISGERGRNTGALSPSQ